MVFFKKIPGKPQYSNALVISIRTPDPAPN